MTQHLVKWLVAYEGGNMTVKEIFKLIHSNENVSINDKKDILNCWTGEGKNIPLRYCDCEVKSIHSEPLDYNESGLIITI